MLLKMAFRNLWRQTRRTLLTGVLIGLATLVLVGTNATSVAVRRNLTNQMILAVTGHLQVRDREATSDPLRPAAGRVLPIGADSAALDRLAAVPGVAAVAPRLRYGGALTQGDLQAEVTLVGVNMAAERAATPRLALAEGRFLTAGEADGLLVSASTAATLAASVGDTVTLIAARPDGSPLALPLRIVGIVDTGPIGLFIDHISYMDLARLQDVVGVPGVTEVKLLLQDGGSQRAVARAVQALLPAGQRLFTSEQLGSEVLGIAAVGDLMFEILFDILSIITLAGVLNTMLMTVAERRREIGMLGALGLRPGRILALFLTEAGLLALLFSLAGIAVAAGAVAYLSRVGIAFGRGVPLVGAERLYPVLDPKLLLQVCPRLMLVALLGAAYPAAQAARSDPVEAIKF